jgi:hypothetical protein
MRASNYFLILFSILSLSSCNNNNNRFFLGAENAKCNLIDTNIFVHTINNNWPTRKPNSIADAVKLLDSVADDNLRCGIIKIRDEDLYFNLGLKIRNNWVRQGTENIKNQLFNKLRLSSVDYSSGLIIDIYRQMLTNKKINLVEHFSKSKNDSSWQTVKNELIKIQTELTE